jgi:predicted P-loop ATPase
MLGPQGIGKTTFLRKLGIDPELVFVGGINPADKDSKVLYSEKVLVILDELESTTKFELSALKSNMTLRHITVRRPYARITETLPRRPLLLHVQTR